MSTQNSDVRKDWYMKRLTTRPRTTAQRAEEGERRRNARRKGNDAIGISSEAGARSHSRALRTAQRRQGSACSWLDWTDAGRSPAHRTEKERKEANEKWSSWAAGKHSLSSGRFGQAEDCANDCQDAVHTRAK
jgi:hypothetical protein